MHIRTLVGGFKLGELRARNERSISLEAGGDYRVPRIFQCFGPAGEKFELEYKVSYQFSLIVKIYLAFLIATPHWICCG